MQSSDSTFGVWLKRQRRVADLTQEALAEQAGCSIDMVRKIEGGAARASRQLMELLLAALDVPLQERPALIRWARTGQSTPQAPSSVSTGVAVESSAPGSTSVTNVAVAEEPGDGVQENPYKGLCAFQERDAPDFFGRELLTARLLSRIFSRENPTRFLAVVGPSGSGKSSVVRAGLVPALRQRKLPGGLTPVVVNLVPGAHPLEELEAAFLRVAVNPPSSLMEQITSGDRGLSRAIKRVLPSDERTEMLLIIDQFEELFTLTKSHEERQILLSGLHEAVTDLFSRVWVVVTLRADFYDHPLMYIPSSELVGRRTEVVGPLTQAEMHQAIVGPAERVGLSLETDLVETIIEDVGDQPGTLPLLEYSLTELYERREGRLLTLRAYRESGGVLGSLAHRAESLFAQLSAAEQEEARQLFLRLVTLGEGIEDTRRRARMVEVTAAARNEVALGQVLDLYGRFRMLTFDRDPITGGPTVEVAHEALLRTWPRLREWLETGRDTLRVQRRLMLTASEWESSGRDASFLARGARLAQFEALASGGDLALTPEEQEYIACSVAKQEKETAVERERQGRELSLQKRAASRLRYLVAALVIFLVIASALSLWALNRSQVAEENSVLAEVNANEAQKSAATAQANFALSEDQGLAAEANLLIKGGGDPQLSALLAIRSLRDQYSPQGNAALLGASTLSYPRQVFPGQFGAFSPDGKYVVTGGSDPTVRMWEAQTGKPVLEFTSSDASGYPGSGIYTDLFSPDGKYILTTVAASAQLRAVATNSVERTFRGHYELVAASAFSHDGKYILTGSLDTTARLWDAQTGRELRQFVGNRREVRGVAFSPDDNLVATASGDSTARIWDRATGKQLHQLTGHTSSVRSVTFSPDGKYILTASEDGTARIWDSSTGQELTRLSGHKGSVNAAVYSPDGRYILTGGADQTVRIWDSKTGQEVRRFTAHLDAVNSVAFSPDGKLLLTAGADNTVKIWDVNAPMGLVQFRGHTGEIYGMQSSTDGKRLLTFSLDETARLWDTSTGQQVQQFTGHLGWVTAGALSPDGKYVATGSHDTTGRVWNAATGAQVALSGLPARYDFPIANIYGDLPYLGPYHQVAVVAFSPDGKEVVSGDMGGNVYVWEAQTGERLQALSIGNAPSSATFSPDGRYLLTSLFTQLSNASGAEIWDARTGQAVRFFKGHTGRVTSVGFSADGKYVLTGSEDRTARIWDADTGEEVRRFSGHTDAVLTVALSADYKELITASADDTVRVWNAATGQELSRFDGTAIGARRVTFSPDGRYVFASDVDNSVSMWPIDYHDTIKSLCKRLLRDFTDGERTEYNITDQQPTCPAP